MKKVSMKIAMAVVMIAVGTLGLQAQNGRGTGTCGTGTCGIGTGTCTNSSLLTAEQKGILEDLCTTFQAEMSTFRAAMVAAPTLADKVSIRQEMNALRVAHIAEVKALLASWGIKTKTAGVGKAKFGNL
jgi:hypothetical protein